MKKTLIVVAALILSWWAKTSPAIAGSFEARNDQIFKEGNQITFRGINWFGLESPPSQYTLGGLSERDYKDIISQIKSLGFNAVRIPFCPAVLKNQVPVAVNFSNGMNADLKGAGTLDILDKVVAELNRQQIYVLLDSHRADCQSISNLWYINGYSETDWINDLKFLSARYKNTDYFMGMDLKNEPHGNATWGTGNQSTDWNTAAEHAGAAVNGVNPNILVFVEGIQDNPQCSSNTGHWYGGNLEPYACTPISAAAIPANKLVLSPHVYGPDVYQQQYFFDTNFPRNMEAIWESHFGYLTNKGLTVVPGEWGGKYGTNGGDLKDISWQDALTAYFTKKGICSSFYWDLNPNSGDTGGVLKDDWRTPVQSKVDMLHRYYSACGGIQNNSVNIQTTVSTPTPRPVNDPPATPPAAGAGSTIEIFAAGTPFQGVYPNADLAINGTVVKSFSDIRGDSRNGSFVTLSYSDNSKITPADKIEVRYTNDAYNGNEDRNLRVDRINVDGINYQSEAPTVHSSGSWSTDSGCADGNKSSEWLDCNGYFEYQIQGNSNSSSFNAQYWDNKDLSGTPRLFRTENGINHDWSYSAADNSLPADRFSARYTGSPQFDNANYKFSLTSDDGARLYIDGQLVIDQWNDHAATTYTATKQLSAGDHEIRLEYYENGGEAVVKLNWEKN